ncbi:porphobilinogen deaminase [Rhinocladiella mackenziei CBS 650.93]|uniref:hydroxymethylbilane synthase n=1 Tax=Rhinocladiella mackenziei CBS 650.93 TaxID=1442369 RepID=A0A0D2G1C9_9EURO|nr:porphobilinogen deaminase [Rhinocladiella mackenziei CBS 650.93]KIX08352.1 porphobilinogen deaminase [Rhinocladiella mackenziei CBS 650.93]
MTTIAVVPGENAAANIDDQTSRSTFNVGSRKSKLALIQTDLVVKALASTCPDNVYAIKARDTAAGDIDKITAFKDMAVKNLWTHELEVLMVEGQLDFLVHSLKDVPTQLPPGCEIGAVLAREDPRDAFVVKAGRKPCNIEDLPSGSVIGTSSIRRTAQIAFKYPHLRVVDVRGNVPTRLAKLDAEDGPFDALILAAAGLIRLGLGDRITQYLDSKSGGMLHAVGQGAIGVENRSRDDRVQRMLSLIDHQKTHLATAAERSLLRTLEGGCSAPLGVETTWVENGDDQTVLELKALVVSTDGKEKSEIDMTEKITSQEEAELFGINAASQLLREGADKILAEIKAKRPTTAADLEEK